MKPTKKGQEFLTSSRKKLTVDYFVGEGGRICMTSEHAYSSFLPEKRNWVLIVNKEYGGYSRDNECKLLI